MEALWVQMMAVKMFGTFMPMLLALPKDHFDVSSVCFGGGHVGPDEGFGDVWVTDDSVVHGGGLEMSS